jgi:hypothetical protein
MGVRGLGEDVGRCGLGGADHVGVDAEGDGGVGVAQAGRHDMDRYPGQQQGRGVEVPQVVEPRVRQWVPSGVARSWGGCGPG